jgi:hypothetical protein
MTARYDGNVFDLDDVQWNAKVTGAILGDNKVSVDWLEGGWHGHLHAESVDGAHYEGKYSYREDPTAGGRFAMTRFQGGQGILLFGTYQCDYDQSVGTWFFHLTPR